MYKAIADAIHSQDLATAEQLLAAIGEDGAENPMTGYYQARLAEARGDLNEAEQKFRQLLVISHSPQLLSKIRAGLGRIQAHHQAEAARSLAEHQAAIEEAKAAPEAQSQGIFVLEPLPPAEKQAKAVQFGEIMKIDPYTARLQLPSRAWRLYRTGAIGELNYYHQQCQAAQIPSFSVPLADILALKVFPVFHIESLSPVVTVSYRINRQEEGSFSFTWQDVGQTVEGLLPIFEECVDVNVRGKIQRKTEILDYARICDLHLPQHQTILRFCDQIYEFTQGVSLDNGDSAQGQRGTAHQQWQQLSQLWQTNLPDKPVWKEFKAFAETALDFQELLKLIDPHIPFLRREETNWDKAFHLYSALAFCRNLPPD
ncbi:MULTISPECIES: hypothetical protein [unclassified Synechocystis]|uniref:hypothetical protein n=1 Tax=unclassified Synechocystis TaxID=2640012 RepID=UPI0003FDA75C|nr:MULTISPECIES: hypothetical protein [unclassified Synechocystis]AIE76010.1 hypothetical protein D082_34820 [Synechocystis sp. PCC 6714]MCT0255082.1 hypothetical protein [Synechocystis sp. CS-94]